MRYLFFLIAFLYSWIFYLFYVMTLGKDWIFRDVQNPKKIEVLSLKDPIVTFYNTTNSDGPLVIQTFFGNLVYEIIIFLCVAFLLFFYFSSVEGKAKIPEGATGFSLRKYLTWANFVSGVKKFSYYLGFLLFYASLYLISKGISLISFSVFLLLFQIAIFIFFFTSKFSPLSRDILKINSLLFSFGYIICFVTIVVSRDNFFTLSDFVNALLPLFIFPTLLYYNKKIENTKHLDQFMVSYFSMYVFVLCLFFLSQYFTLQVGIWMVFIFSIFGVIWLDYFPKVQILKNNAELLKHIGIIFSYLGVISGVIFLLRSFSWVIFVLLFLQIGYHTYVHIKYISFVSYTVSIVLGIFLLYYTIGYFSLMEIISKPYFIFSLMVSFAFVFFTYLIRFRMPREIFILHMIAYGVNFYAVVIFLILIVKNFSILNLGVLLFFESLFFFVSYNKLSKGTKKELIH